jgi:ADP-ribosylglycohydrolase
MKPIERAKLSFEGLYTGDTFGQQFFGKDEIVLDYIRQRSVPEAPWEYTDDTAMALSILYILEKHGEIFQDELAHSFAKEYQRDFRRGYGPSMHDTLRKIYAGESWKDVTTSVFDGMGSYGNGAAMRISPLGAYFAENINKAVEQAILSAEVTHAHSEASAGAIGVAVAAAIAYQWKQQNKVVNISEFLTTISKWLPESEVKSRVLQATRFSSNTTIEHAVSVLGNGVLVSAQDTVPLALWCAAKHLDNFPEAMWLTVSALGDRDTTCAMVGGIVTSYTGLEGIPVKWREAREKIIDWKGIPL